MNPAFYRVSTLYLTSIRLPMKFGAISLKTILLLLGITAGSHLLAQQYDSNLNKYASINSNAPAANRMHQQADSIKSELEKAGFVVVREAEIPMESQYEMPVIMALTQGSYYQFVFIGDESSSLHEVRMYDWDEKQVVYERRYGYSEGNVISYPYIAKFSEYHMMKPVQVNKKKKSDLKGYVILFKKTQ